MEMIFDILFLFLVSVSLWTSFFFFRLLKQVKVLALDLQMQNASLMKKVEDLDIKNEQLNADLHVAILELACALTEEKTERKNNWDAIKDAFRGPVRMEANARSQ